jgi:hypothetical protein
MSTLEPFGPDIWVTDGPDVDFFFFPYPTRMAVIRLSNGALFIWSPVALSPEIKNEVDALGPVAHLVSPNKIHHLFLGEWKRAYPAARLYAAPGLPRRRRDLSFDAVLGDRPEPAWANDIDQVALSGNLFMTEIAFFHRPSRTALVADYLQNFRRDRYKGWRGWLARMDGLVQPVSSAPRELRLTYWNRAAGRRALARMLAWNAEKVIVAHGELIQRDGTEFIRHGFVWLRQ